MYEHQIQSDVMDTKGRVWKTCVLRTGVQWRAFLRSCSVLLIQITEYTMFYN
jgi:hypothetical protein